MFIRLVYPPSPQINRVKHVFDKNALVIIINALVFSKLFYCSSVWSNTTQTNLDQLQAVQNFVCRTVSGAGKLDHTTPSNVKGLCAGSREATAILSTCSVLVFKCMTRCAPAYLTSIKVRKKIGRFDKDNQELGNVETLGVENTPLLHC